MGLDNNLGGSFKAALQTATIANETMFEHETQESVAHPNGLTKYIKRFGAASDTIIADNGDTIVTDSGDSLATDDRVGLPVYPYVWDAIIGDVETVTVGIEAGEFGGPYLESSSRRVDGPNLGEATTWRVGTHYMGIRIGEEDPAGDRGDFELLSDRARGSGLWTGGNWVLMGTIGNIYYAWNGNISFAPKAEWRVVVEAPVTEIKLAYSLTGLEEDEVLAITYSIPADESPSMHDIFGDPVENAGAAGIGHGTTPDGGPPLIWLNGIKGGGYQDVSVKSFRWTANGLGYFYDYTAVNFDPLGSIDLPYDANSTTNTSSRWPNDTSNVMAPFDDMTTGGLGLPAALYPSLYPWEQWNTNFNSSATSRKRDTSYPVTYATHPHRSPILPLAEGDPMVLKLGFGDEFKLLAGLQSTVVSSTYATWLDQFTAVQNGTYVPTEYPPVNSYVRIYVNGVRGVDD